jgi:hypothetical protein
MTVKYAGAVTGALGYSLEDVSNGTGLMAYARVKADQAGTYSACYYDTYHRPDERCRG